MSILGRLFAGAGRAKRRSWTLDEIRALVAEGKFAEAELASASLSDTTPDFSVTWICLLAELAFRQNQDGRAEELFREALKQSPGFPDAHYGLSLVLLENGAIEAALQHVQFAKGGKPDDARYLAQLGLCHLHLRNFSIAEGPLRAAVQLSQHDKNAWNNLGIVARARGDLGEALAYFRKALAIDPSFHNATENVERLLAEVEASGGVWQTVEQPAARPGSDDAPWRESWKKIMEDFRSGQVEKALRAAESVADHWADEVDAVLELASLYHLCGEGRSAIDTLEAYLVSHMQEGRAWGGLGASYLKLGELAQAERCLVKASKLGDESTQTVMNLAQALHHQDKYTAAAEVLERIPAGELSLSGRKQLAASLVMACKYEPASLLYEELIAGGLSELSAALGGLGMALANLGRFDEAVALLDRVIADYPSEPHLRSQRSHILLLRQEFRRGWEDYAYRGLSDTKNFRVLPFPKWNGEPLEGKAVIVLAEQGLGDQVMFASCLTDLLARRPRKIYVEVIDRVAKTLARSFPQCQIVPTRQNRDLNWARELQEVAYYVPLGDLPRFFRSELAAFPRAPYLTSDPERVEYWKAELEQAGPRPWVGVSWRGGTAATRTKLRTMKPSDLAPLLNGVTATWVSLQYGEVGQDLQEFTRAGALVSHWNDAIRDLDEFAALISALDAVVTVCNTTVHYAGALGCPVLVMAPEIPEWRYGLDTPTMPWYPQVEVIRQRQFGKWNDVTDAVEQRLMTYLSNFTPGEG